ncbi:hypothetical protein ABH930_000148 [Kitasatospora sp. GAS204A]|uniref:SCO2583/SCO2584 N-terminal domain-containing protein n=1 Tax=unclassified Kitasatospora TaxID=2633591 RepID=UPI0024770EF1|nr:hypothetical protein [Kitasatospora sp. GAS204B]MDH6116729.1 hypothetical protein [Kitasatospora sp. GAS204B]
MSITEDPPQPPGEEPDPFADLVLDEEFVKGATVKEQSGRARMLSAKWLREPPQPEQAWRPPTETRRRWYQRRAAPVDPWGNKRRTKRNWQAPVFVLLAIAVVAAGLNVNGLHSWYVNNFGGGSSGSGSAAAGAPPVPVVTQAPETAQPTAAPSTADPQTPTVAQPWLGSPADAWPAGPDAVVLPPAQATGVFSQDQVAGQLKLVKDFLVGSNLDPTVLSGGTPQQVLDLLGGKSLAAFKDSLAHPGPTNDPTSWISRFNPKTAIPAGNVVKLQGRITFAADTAKDDPDGVLVHTDYTFVYALVPGPQQFDPNSVPSASPTGGGNAQSVALLSLDPNAVVTREIVRRTQDFVFYDPAKFNVSPHKLYFGQGNSSLGNNYCAIGDGWLEPLFPQTGNIDGAAPSSGPTMDPYDRSQALPDDQKCRTDSRS